MRAAAVFLLSLLLAPAAALACAGDFMVAGGPLKLAVTPQPAPVPLNRPFALELRVCEGAVAAMAVDAHMPAHRHGMNYRTAVTQTAPGTWRAEGLLFHMPGEWEFVFELRLADGGSRRLVHSLRLR